MNSLFKKLVLFDIDETIICSDGVGRRAISRALSSRLGFTPSYIAMSGKTDPQILQEMMLTSGYSKDDFEQRQNELIDLYLELLGEELKRASNYYLHNGVLDVLNELDQHDSIGLGLLTGNVERGARLKLDKFGLNKYFPIGAFGSDSPNRLDLPAIARTRAELHYNSVFEPSQIVIIGDAVNDVLCAKHYGTICIAVNTGSTSRGELAELAPDYLFASLEDTQTVMSAILSD